MIRIEIVTLFPDLVRGALGFGVLGRAVARGLVQVGFEDPRSHARGAHRSVDDRPFGGGPGMVGMPQPWAAAIDAAHARLGGQALRVHLSAQGARFTQRDASGVAALGEQALQSGAAPPGLVLVASRYEGLDERVIESRIDREWSIGDYVLSGGEIAALVVVDAVVRLLPGALGDSESSVEESFSAARLDWPHYTRPPEWEGRRVPQTLLGGNHAQIARWRRLQSLRRTLERRPDLIGERPLDAEERALLADGRAPLDE